LVIVGGKGGVGKSSVAAAIALAEARRRDVVLLSTDPAHSLGDVLCRPIGDPGARLAPRLWVRELDAGLAMDRRRRRVREGIEALFDGLRRSALDLAYDRAILADLLDMTPPGMDELMALLEIVELTDGRAPPGSLLVLDTAPTGHTLRLLAMPAQVLEWVHAVLGICLKYRGVVKLGDIAADLLALSRELRSLSSLLCDPVRTRFIPVLRPERLPCEETADLLARLEELRISAGPAVINGTVTARCASCRAEGQAQARQMRAIDDLLDRHSMQRVLAPRASPAPTGPAGLRTWVQLWKPAEPRGAAAAWV
jgi:arsenite-transporting ATPase